MEYIDYRILEVALDIRREHARRWAEARNSPVRAKTRLPSLSGWITSILRPAEGDKALLELTTVTR